MDFDATGFTITPLADGAKASPHTVYAHMLYENSDPFILYEPGGYLDVRGASYTALDDTRVRVEGSQWVPSQDYTVKLEGARVAGYQVVAMALLRDTRYVANAQEWADDIAAKARAKVEARLGITDFHIELRLIGQNASFGPLETKASTPNEIGVTAIVTASTEERASEIAKILNPYLLHHPLTQEEEQPTFAFLFSPPEMVRGATYAFALHHTLTLTDPMEAFRLEVHQIG